MNGCSADKFYGYPVIIKKKSVFKPSWIKVSRRMSSHIRGPSHFWKEFGKQAEALATAFEESNDSDVFCTFVYQGDNDYRKFMVAHPEMYWWHYEHRPAEKRCSYEIIPENSPCRLYLDLEYSIELNPDKDGPSMTNTIIHVFNAYLLTHWGLSCTINNVLNLDSTTTEKFSRHIIFNIKNIAFKNNYHIGRLVKSICKDIADYVLLKEKQHDVLNSFDKIELEKLFVKTKKGRRLFIDTAVYTANRHFRIYKSTKWGKQSNLILSEDCKYIPSTLHKDKELNIFLDSLISYFITKNDLTLLEYFGNDTVEAKCFNKETVRYKNCKSNGCNSQYLILDKYICNLIHPGKIRLCKFLTSVKMLVYETSGYRYCENIGRCHNSNNVSLIVDLKSKMLRQKCHDEDCFGFIPQPKCLPEEVYFEIDEEGDMLISCAVVTEDM